LIPAHPPRGVSTIQGNFLSPAVQAEVRAYVQDPDLGRSRNKHGSSEQKEGYTEDEFKELEQDYIDLERQAQLEGVDTEALGTPDCAQEAEKEQESKLPLKERDRHRGRVVDMVLSDMCEPWDQTAGFSARSLSDPYSRMANTSGIAFKDHANSMVRLRLSWAWCEATLY
jgi:21S rRNA (uridine2791-2'-O)-methyltransferase